MTDDAERMTDPLLEAAAANRGGRVWSYDGTKGTEREVSELIAALVSRGQARRGRRDRHLSRVTRRT